MKDKGGSRRTTDETRIEKCFSDQFCAILYQYLREIQSSQSNDPRRVISLATRADSRGAHGRVEDWVSDGCVVDCQSEIDGAPE
jgi:hypothetical protein